MIKQRWLFVVSILLFLGAAGFGVERLIFLAGAQRTNGTVENVSSSNDQCRSGGRRYRRYYDCTKFKAHIAFKTQAGVLAGFGVGAGSARGHNQPLVRASFRVGQFVPVVYSPRNPKKAYENTTMGVWGGPIILLAVQIAALIASFCEPKQR